MTSRYGSRLLGAALLLMLAGCGAAPSETTAPYGIAARFVPGGPVDVITVTVDDPLPLRRAVLVGPGGLTVPAYSLDVTPRPTEASTPAGGAFPTTPGLARTVTRNDTILSTALLRLPDPVLYVHSWQAWRIRLHLGSAEGGRDVTLAAPKPPPNEA